MTHEEATDLLRAERERLEAERERLERSLGAEGALQDEPRSAGDAGQADYERARDLARQEQLAQEMAALERAEERLATGRYGLSVESGEPIPDGRLRILPTAELTVPEQSALDHRAG